MNGTRGAITVSATCGPVATAAPGTGESTQIMGECRFSPGKAAFTRTSSCAEDANARMISNVPGLAFTSHFQFRGVALPSGEFKVSRDVDRVECKA